MHSLRIPIVRRLLLLAVTLFAALLVLGLSPASFETPAGLSQAGQAPPSFALSHPALSMRGKLSVTGESGYGAGDDAAGSRQAAFCNPLDTTCLAQAALSAILTPVIRTLTAFCDAVLSNVAAALSAPAPGPGSRLARVGQRSVTTPMAQTQIQTQTQVQGQGQGPTTAAPGPLSFNFLTQTPLCFSTLYSPCAPSALDGAIAPFSGWTRAVAFAALALLLALGGFGLSLGQQAGWRVQGVSQLIPRLVLTALAAWMAPSIVQVGIDLNNLLCQGALQVAQIGILATQIRNLANPANPTSNLLVLLFLLAATVMALLLIGQMALRLAFVALLGALAPLGLFCFGLPLTSGWGRLWMQQFSLAVFVQFVPGAAPPRARAATCTNCTKTARLNCCIHNRP